MALGLAEVGIGERIGCSGTTSSYGGSRGRCVEICSGAERLRAGEPKDLDVALKCRCHARPNNRVNQIRTVRSEQRLRHFEPAPRDGLVERTLRIGDIEVSHDQPVFVADERFVRSLLRFTDEQMIKILRRPYWVYAWDCRRTDPKWMPPWPQSTTWSSTSFAHCKTNTESSLSRTASQAPTSSKRSEARRGGRRAPQHHPLYRSARRPRAEYARNPHLQNRRDRRRPPRSRCRVRRRRQLGHRPTAVRRNLLLHPRPPLSPELVRRAPRPGHPHAPEEGWGTRSECASEGPSHPR